MKTNTKHRIPPYKRPIFIIIVTLIVAVVVTVAVMLLSKPSGDGSPDQQKTPSTRPSVSQSNTPGAIAEPENPDGVTQYEGENPNTLDELTGYLARRTINYERGILLVAANINQYLNSEGSCHLRLLKGDQEVFASTLAAISDVSSSICGAFEIPISGLSGEYQIEIQISGDGKTGIIRDNIALEGRES